MADQLGNLIERLRQCVSGLDGAELSGNEAMELCAQFATVERLGAAGKLITAERVSATEAWRPGGSRSAADWVARRSGSDAEQAREGIEAAGRLGRCPLVAARLRSGELSEEQTQAIVEAVAVRPEVESHLVEFAQSNSLRRLREECRRVKNVAPSAAEEYREVHRQREFRTWTGRDGARCFSGRVTADAGAPFIAAIEQRTAEHVRAAQREGRREPFPAYAADALLELVTEERGGARQPAGPKTTMIVHVAYEAISRGAVADGEVCEISGVGPVPLDVARNLAADSILRVLVTKGGQPTAVTPGVRTVPRALRLLLEARDPHCVVPGCDVTRGLQIDHRKGFAVLGPTDLQNCARLCKRHHDMKTYLGYRLGWAGDGSRTFEPPDDYIYPDPAADGPTCTGDGPTGTGRRHAPGADGSRRGVAGRPSGGQRPGDAGGSSGQLALVGAGTSGPAP